MITVFKRDGIWPPIVPSVVLVESLTGRQRADALTNRFLKTWRPAQATLTASFMPAA